MHLWVKALHVIAIISWMAGLLYLPRLFVYHAGVGPGPQSELFKTMERRLLRFIMIPAMLVAWATGLWLAYDGGFFRDGWFHGKLLAAILLTGVHFYDGFLQRAFAEGRNTHSSKFYRFYNELPTLLMIVAVILVIVRPF
ncbi:protoporphyrinogen oxidase HemJ [Methylocystis bryophila]|uniref:Protoporphyrinogen IX oxidase n=1 Tax=Methylocystis bryophila TaxID=655015 RepID=A0A1W6MV13_9HYPH|nr:protoporphyrinogen oxidase HemJ [Methylocystis bryophila]ARN81329.1 TIGR00701 family protein [Methylocystis bryophila]BDV37310.1 membrane protein [Methylocystis bryophila]